MTHAPRVMRATITGQAVKQVAWQSQWHLLQWQKNKRKQKHNKKYHFVSTPKIKRILVVWCSGPATATSSQVQSAKIILDGFSQQGCLDS
jgi:hypothetical protein